MIRLRGPWRYTPLARTRMLSDGTTCDVGGQLPPGGRAEMPADWGESLGVDFYGRVQYCRSFGCPTGITALQHVKLVIEKVDAFASCWLNDEPLGTIELGALSYCVDITNHLRPRNLLTIEVELPETDATSAPLPRGERQGRPGGLIGEVRLEIHSHATELM